MTEPLVLYAAIIESVTWKKSLSSPVYPWFLCPLSGAVTFPAGLHLVYPFGCLKGAPATATTPIDRISRPSCFHAIALAVHSLPVKATGVRMRMWFRPTWASKRLFVCVSVNGQSQTGVWLQQGGKLAAPALLFFYNNNRWPPAAAAAAAPWFTLSSCSARWKRKEEAVPHPSRRFIFGEDGSSC